MQQKIPLHTEAGFLFSRKNKTYLMIPAKYFTVRTS